MLFNSFKAGYLKRLDWNLYCRLTDPVAKRLYRLLDKRFYHDHEVTFDLHDLAFRHIRLSENYNTAQIKRALAKGFLELESLWELRTVSANRRFVKQRTGRWRVVFQRKSERKAMRKTAQGELAKGDLEVELVRRGIGFSVAAELVGQQPAESVRAMVELFDWYAKRNQAKRPGFLVDAIRNSGKYRFPPGFESSAQRTQRQAESRRHIQAQREKRTAREERQREKENARLEPFMDFWSGLDELARTEFEIRAITAAASLKRDGYLRLKKAGGQAFEEYRQVILRDFYEDTVIAAKA